MFYLVTCVFTACNKPPTNMMEVIQLNNETNLINNSFPIWSKPNSCPTKF
jgi:hypothetical protein